MRMMTLGLNEIAQEAEIDLVHFRAAIGGMFVPDGVAEAISYAPERYMWSIELTSRGEPLVVRYRVHPLMRMPEMRAELAKAIHKFRGSVRLVMYVGTIAQVNDYLKENIRLITSPTEYEQ